MKWFRWYHGTVDDRKWLVISRRSGQDRAVVIAVWCALLEFASQAEERGCVRDFDCESLDALLDARDGACASVLAALVEKGLVRDGRLSAWDKRQPRREDEGTAERQRCRRQRLALPPAGAVPPAGDAGGEGAFSCVDAEIIPPENSTDYDERHAASRVVAGGYAPEEEEEKIFQLSPPSPPSSGERRRGFGFLRASACRSGRPTAGGGPAFRGVRRYGVSAACGRLPSRSRRAARRSACRLADARAAKRPSRVAASASGA